MMSELELQYVLVKIRPAAFCTCGRRGNDSYNNVLHNNEHLITTLKSLTD